MENTLYEGYSQASKTIHIPTVGRYFDYQGKFYAI